MLPIAHFVASQTKPIYPGAHRRPPRETRRPSAGRLVAALRRKPVLRVSKTGAAR